MDIKCLVDCKVMSLITTRSNFIVMEYDCSIGSFTSKVIKVLFNKYTEVFNYEENPNINTHTSDLNNNKTTQVLLYDKLEE